MIDPKLVIEFSLAIVTIGSVIASVTWAFAKMRSATDVLAESNRALARSVDQLRRTVECMDKKVDEQNTRLSRVEGQIGKQ